MYQCTTSGWNLFIVKKKKTKCSKLDELLQTSSGECSVVICTVMSTASMFLLNICQNEEQVLITVLSCIVTC